MRSSRNPRECVRAVSRRDLLRTATALAAGLPTLPLAAEAATALAFSSGGAPPASRPGGEPPAVRAEDAYRIRLAAAAFERDQASAGVGANGDEESPPGY